MMKYVCPESIAQILASLNILYTINVNGYHQYHNILLKFNIRDDILFAFSIHILY